MKKPSTCYVRCERASRGPSPPPRIILRTWSRGAFDPTARQPRTGRSPRRSSRLSARRRCRTGPPLESWVVALLRRLRTAVGPLRRCRRLLDTSSDFSWLIGIARLPQVGRVILTHSHVEVNRKNLFCYKNQKLE